MINENDMDDLLKAVRDYVSAADTQGEMVSRFMTIKEIVARLHEHERELFKNRGH